MDKTQLGGLFYPTKDQFGNKIPFDSLFIPYIYREIYFEGVYIDVLNQKEDMVIVDVGANIGITVDHFRKHAKKVYAIEPSPEHFKALARNKEFNKWNNVEIFQLAIADKDGEAIINCLPTNRTCNSITNDYGQGGSPCKTLRMDTFFKENKIEHVDFMKFDTEGGEDMILRSEGFKNVVDKIDAIEVEFHFPTWMLLVQYMASLGYKARQFESSAKIVLFFK
jgi:FkbM family methyltransferase